MRSRSRLPAPGTSLSNYVLPNAVSGPVGTIDPARLIYTANSASRLVGAPNPAFTGEVTGLAHGDTLAGVTMGTLVFTSSASASSGPGFYPIDGFGLTLINGNYVLAQAPSNVDALVIGSQSSFAVNPSVFASYAQLYFENVDFNSRFASPDCDPTAISAAIRTTGRTTLNGEDASCH
jgi:MBG domain (YGX type)